MEDGGSRIKEKDMRPSPVSRWLIVLLAVLAAACVAGALIWGMIQLLTGPGIGGRP
jgi:hypothetical protein